MRFKTLPNITTITSGQPAQIRLPVGPTYDSIKLVLGATADPGLTGVTNVKVVVDGNTIQEYADLGVLDSLNQYHGRDAVSGGGTVANPYIATIYFRRPEIASFLSLSEVDAERVTSLRTGKVGNAYVELTITGAGAFCTAFADEVPVNAPEAPGLITRVKRVPSNLAAGAQNILQDMSRGDGSAGLIAVHIKASDVTAINSLKEGGYLVMDAVTKVALQSFQNDNGKVPVSGYTVIDLCANGNLNELLMMHPKRELLANIQKTAGGATDYYVEILDRLGSGNW